MSQDKQLQTIFVEALELSTAEEREHYLADACGTDAELRAKALKLLAAHDDAEGFLETQATQPIRTDGVKLTHNPVVTEGPGSLIRGYKLLQEIGEGGFGVVYMAEQKEPIKRKVAFKVIKPGMDTRQVVARFEAERQALALMDHPNIARVLDAGTTESGRPYFVMELVKGIPIIEFCDKNKLSMEDRLAIFLKVCSAVQHAHQKGIIHRDLKPSNVLITLHDGVPVPKVIDFGIAKALNQELTEKSLFTAYGQMIGTPQYMSPEQAEMSGLDVDTRSDIYSLGVLLYELLTGRTPIELGKLRKAGLEEMKRMIQEDEAAKPSMMISTMGDTATTVADHRRVDPRKLTEHLKGDLDWIIMKALEKDRSRRYDSAAAFSNDIQRHMRHEPVEAAAPGLIYLFSKFSRRHRRMLAVAAAVFVSLLAGMIGMSFLYFDAETQREAAEAARAQAHQQSEKATQEKERAMAARKNEQEQRRIAVLEKAKAVQASAAATAAQRDAERAARSEADARKLTEQEAEKTRQALYSADIQLASQIWDSGSGAVESVDKILTSHLPFEGQPDLRDFAWRYQWDQLHRTAIFHRQFGDNTRAIFLPSGRLLTCDDSLVVREWDLNTGKPLREVAIVTTNSIRNLRLSPDGRKLAIVKKGFSTAVFDTHSGELIKQQTRRFPAFSIGFSSDSSALFIGSGTFNRQGRATSPRFQFWDLATDEQRWLECDSSVRRVPRSWALSPDSKTLLMPHGAIGRDLALQPTESGGVRILEEHTTTVYSLAWSAAGDALVSGDASGRIVVWDPRTWTIKRSIAGHPSGVQAMAFSRDGRRLATGGADGAVKVWDLSDGELVVQYRGHTDSIKSLDFSADDRRLCSVDTIGAVNCWDLSDSNSAPFWSESESEHSRITHSADGVWLAANGDQLRLWNLREGGKPKVFEEGGHCVAFSHDSRLLAWGDNRGHIRVWDVKNEEIIHDFAPSTPVGALAFSPNGDHLVGGMGVPFLRSRARQCPLWVFDLKSGEKLPSLPHHRGHVAAIRFSRDGTHLASASHDGKVALWNTKNWTVQKEFKIPGTAFYSVDFSNDGAHVAAGADRSIHVWQLDTSELIATLEGHGNWVTDIAFAPDGKTLASVSWDHTVKLWNLSSWLETRTLRSHQGWVNGLAFSPDGNRLLTTDILGVIHQWNATSMTEIDEDPSTLTSVLRLADVDKNRGNYRAAERLYRKAAQLQQQRLGNHHLETLNTRRQVGLSVYRQQRYAEAAIEGEKSLAVALATPGAGAIAEQVISNVRGAYRKAVAQLSNAGDLEAADNLLASATDKARNMLGTNHVMVAEYLHDHGKILAQRDDLQMAEKKFREALIIRRAESPADDSLIADTVHELGVLNHRLKRHETAEIQLRQALESRRGRVNEKPDELAATLFHLASVRIAIGGKAPVREGEALLIEALGHETEQDLRIAIVNQLVKLNAASQREDRALRWKALLTAEQGDPHQAADQLRKLLARQKADSGPDAPETVATRKALLELNGQLADRHVSNNEHDQAVLMLKDYAQHHPSDHLRTSQLGTLLAYLENTAEHRAWCRRIGQQFESSNDPDALFAVARSALLLDHYEDPESTRSIIRLTRKAWRLQPGHPDAALIIGLAECRARRTQQASYWLGRVISDNASGNRELAFYLAAIRSAVAGSEGRMKAALNMALERVPRNPKTKHWRDRLETLVIQREARQRDEEFDGNAAIQPPLTPRFPVTTDPIDPRSTHATAKQIDLSEHFNAAFTQHWHGRSAEPDSLNLKDLPRGLQSFDDTLFDVRGVLQLGGVYTHRSLLDYDNRVRPVKVDQSCHKLHFLHALGWGLGIPVGQGVGRFEINYSDGETVSVPLAYGEQTLDWVARADDPEITDPNTSIAWQGGSKEKPTRLFHTVWKNPRPEAEIDHIVFANQERVGPAPFLLAVTAE